MFNKFITFFMKFITNFNILFNQIRQRLIGCDCSVCISKKFYCGICKKSLMHLSNARNNENTYFFCHDNTMDRCQIDIDRYPTSNIYPAYFIVQYKQDNRLIKISSIRDGILLQIFFYHKDRPFISNDYIETHTLPSSFSNHVNRFVAMNKEERDIFLEKMKLLV